MIPDDPERLPPARRRRARRPLAPLNHDEQADFITGLAHRAAPTLGFFFLSLISGLVIAAGLTLDSTPVVLLGVLVAPLMAPLVGIALGTIIGSPGYFVRSLLGFAVGSLFVFSAGAVVGYFPPK